MMTTSQTDSIPDPKQWASLTEIGFLFGISALVVDKALKTAGWRQPDGQPYLTAITNKQALVYNTPVKIGSGQKVLRQHIVWNRQKAYELLCSLKFHPIGHPDDNAFLVAAKIEHILKSADVKKVKHKVAAPWGEKKASTYFSQALLEVEKAKRMRLAFDIVHHLEHTMGRSLPALEVIFQDSPVSWEEFKRQKLMTLVKPSQSTSDTVKKPKI